MNNGWTLLLFPFLCADLISPSYGGEPVIAKPSYHVEITLNRAELIKLDWRVIPKLMMEFRAIKSEEKKGFNRVDGSVVPLSVAGFLSLREDDIFISLNDKPIRDAFDWFRITELLDKSGKAVAVVERDGQLVQFTYRVK